MEEIRNILRVQNLVKTKEHQNNLRRDKKKKQIIKKFETH